MEIHVAFIFILTCRIFFLFALKEHATTKGNLEEVKVELQEKVILVFVICQNPQIHVYFNY